MKQIYFWVITFLAAAAGFEFGMWQQSWFAGTWMFQIAFSLLYVIVVSTDWIAFEIRMGMAWPRSEK